MEQLSQILSVDTALKATTGVWCLPTYLVSPIIVKFTSISAFGEVKLILDYLLPTKLFPLLVKGVVRLATKPSRETITIPPSVNAPQLSVVSKDMLFIQVEQPRHKPDIHDEGILMENNMKPVHQEVDSGSICNIPLWSR